MNDELYLTRQYRKVLDAIVGEYFLNPPASYTGVRYDDFMKRIPDTFRNRKIRNNIVLIVKYLEHYGYFESCSYYVESGKVDVIPSSKALFYKNAYHKQLFGTIYRDIFIPVISAAIGALITLLVSA
ncbi:MAG: hypothetical protein IJM44_03580 [Ruminococcus sp.]|nr:hypothetical protein [Ruminococcus sp.]